MIGPSAPYREKVKIFRTGFARCLRVKQCTGHYQGLKAALRSLSPKAALDMSVHHHIVIQPILSLVGESFCAVLLPQDFQQLDDLTDDVYI